MPDTRNAVLTYASGDCIAYVAPLNTLPPSGPNSTAPLGAPWLCAGWIDTGGYIFKQTPVLKDILASGTLEPIRTILQSQTKTFDVNFLEAVNPMARALYDDINVNFLDPAPGSSIASYIFPDVPTDNRYALVLDSLDGDKEIRWFAPNFKVTARGQDQVTQADAEQLQMTFTLYPALIGGTRSCLLKYLNYGAAGLAAIQNTYFTQ